MAPAQFLCPSDGSKCLSLTGRRGKWAWASRSPCRGRRPVGQGSLSGHVPRPPQPPTRSLQLCKGIWTTLTKKQNKKQKQHFLAMVVFFLFASLPFQPPRGLFWGPLSCLNPLVSVSGDEAGPCPGGAGGGGARPRGGQGPRSVPRPPLVLLMYVFCAMPIKHAS